MLIYGIKRIGLALAIVLVAMTMLFSMIYVVPGDPASIALGPRATPEMKAQLIARMGVSVRDVIREKGTPYAELGLDDPALSDDQLLDTMMAHPVLINRPIVVTPLGVRLCRPSETVIDILPPQQGEFVKEDGEPVVDAAGRRVGLA